MKESKTKGIININMGIDPMAKNYLAENIKGAIFSDESGERYFPDNETVSRVGQLKTIELKRYPLKDGGFAEEFVQAIMKVDDGRKFHFLGLNANGANKIWSIKKMKEKISKEICSKN